MSDKRYPCARCGVMRTKGQGGTVFTVCATCWTRDAAAIRERDEAREQADEHVRGHEGAMVLVHEFKAELDTLRLRLAACERERDEAVAQMKNEVLESLSTAHHIAHAAEKERNAAIQRAALAEGKLRETTYAALAAREQGEADTVARIVAWLDDVAGALRCGAWRGKEGA